MFEALKKKLASWLGPREEKKEEVPKKAEKKKEEKPKAKDKKQEYKVSIPKKPAKEEKVEFSSKSKPQISPVKKGKEEQKFGLEEINPKTYKEEKYTEEIEGETLKERKVSKEFIKEIKKEKKNLENEAVPQIDDSEVEEIRKEEKEDKEEPKRGFFSRLIHKMSSSKLTQEQFDEIFMELELALLENNVALEVVDKIKESLSKQLVGENMKKADAEKKVLESLKDSITSVLIEPPNLINEIKNKKGIYTIIFFGINGSGKTTSIAKLAYKLKQANISCVLAAADTFRAASIEQLQKHGEKLDIPVIAQNYGTDPAAVAFDAKKYAEKNKIKAVLIDTAGRMYTKANLLKEMEKIIRVTQPDLKIFVGESITGNDGTEQAKTFNEAVGIDGIILSKADVDEKAGTILSVSQVTSKPIYFLGTGQEYKDLEVFSKKTVLKNIGLD